MIERVIQTRWIAAGVVAAVLCAAPAFAAKKAWNKLAGAGVSKATGALTLDQAQASGTQPTDAQVASDKDQTLHAMKDEMDRSKARLQLTGVEKPFYIQFQLLDVDIREITTSFGALLASNTTRNRFM